MKLLLIQTIRSTDFSTGDYSVLFLGHARRPQCHHQSHYVLFQKDFPIILLKSLSKFFSPLTSIMAQPFHAQISGQNQYHSFLINVQFFHFLSKSQSLFISCHFSHISHMWISSWSSW